MAEPVSRPRLDDHRRPAECRPGIPDVLRRHRTGLPRLRRSAALGQETYTEGPGAAAPVSAMGRLPSHARADGPCRHLRQFAPAGAARTMTALGCRVWAIADGHIPLVSHG